jgi:hypothetical protein
VLLVLPGAVQQCRHARHGEGLELSQLAGQQHVQRKLVASENTQHLRVILLRVELGQLAGMDMAAQGHAGNPLTDNRQLSIYLLIPALHRRQAAPGVH